MRGWASMTNRRSLLLAIEAQHFKTTKSRSPGSAAFSLDGRRVVTASEMAKWPYNTSEWKQWLVDTRAGKKPPLPSTQ